MSTELQNEFKDNWDGMKPLQPALPNVEFVKGNLSNSFGGATMASSPVVMPQLQNVMNPPDPIVLPEKPQVDLNQVDTVGYALRNGSFESSKMGDMQYLGASVASTMTELFGSMKSKEPEAGQFDPSLNPNAPTPQLALNNFVPKPTGALFGL